MINILFICHGNICRSTMAEFVFKNLVSVRGISDEFNIASAGTSSEELGNDTHYGTKAKLTEMKIPFAARKARRVSTKDYDAYDYLICMDKNNVSNLMRIIGDDSDNKVHLLLEFAGYGGDIADPWYSGNFDKTYNDVLSGCVGLLKHVGM